MRSRHGALHPVSVGLCPRTLFALGTFLVGCQHAGDAASGPSISMFGAYADPSGTIGTIDLSGRLPAPNPDESITVRGHFRRPGRPELSLFGWFNQNPNPQSVAFGTTAEDYAFNGSFFTGGDIASWYTSGPDGDGLFMVFRGAYQNTVTAYCASAICTAPAGCTVGGQLVLIVKGSEAAVTVSLGSSVGTGDGSARSGRIEVPVPSATAELTFQGQFSGPDATGTWVDATNGRSGTWRGSTDQCP